MNPTDNPRWEATLTLFDALAELPESVCAERLALVAETEPELAADVAAMLAADRHRSGILDTAAQDLAPELREILLALAEADPFCSCRSDASGSKRDLDQD